MSDEKRPVIVSSGWVIPMGTACLIAGVVFGGYKWLESELTCLRQKDALQDITVRDVQRDSWTTYDAQWYTRTLKSNLRKSGHSELADTVPQVDERLEDRKR